MPDISLLVPLAEQLNATVAELLQGRRVEEERRFTREETEELIRKALTFSAEPPERRQARTKKYLPVYVICCVLGVAGALAVWAAGLADVEGALALVGAIRPARRAACSSAQGVPETAKTSLLPELAAERKTGYCFSKCGRAGCRAV